MVKTTEDYYSRSLAERKSYLDTISEAYLCKSIIFENKRYNPKKCEESQLLYYPKYICVIIQYITEVSESKLAVFAKQLFEEKTKATIPKCVYNFRLVSGELS